MTSSRSSASSPAEDSFSSATTRWERLRRLEPAELLAGLQAVVVLPVMAVALHRWGYTRVQEHLGRRTARVVLAGEVPDDPGLPERMAWAVELAARRGPWPANCLQRSVTLWWFLARRGVHATICIGVRRRPGSSVGGPLDFHAWVEHGGRVLNDSPTIRHMFASFDRAIVPPDARWW